MKYDDYCAFYSPQHGGYKLFCGFKVSPPACSFKTKVCLLREEMRGKCSEVKREVTWIESMPKFKITYMHHGRKEMYAWDYTMQRDDEDN